MTNFLKRALMRGKRQQNGDAAGACVCMCERERVCVGWGVGGGAFSSANFHKEDNFNRGYGEKSGFIYFYAFV